MTKIQKTQIIVSVMINSAGPLLPADNEEVQSYLNKSSDSTIDSMYEMSKMLTDVDEWENLHLQLNNNE